MKEQKPNDQKTKMPVLKANQHPRATAHDKPKRSASMTQTEARSHKPHVRLNRHVQGQLGDALQAMYETIVQEGVPDRFAKLLAQIDENGGIPARTKPAAETRGSQEPGNNDVESVSTQRADRPLPKTASLPKATDKGSS